jgi:hypothetical protein
MAGITALDGLPVYTATVTCSMPQMVANTATTATRIRNQRIRGSGGICVS